MLGRLSGSLSGLGVESMSVGDSELGEVSADHVEFNLDGLVISSGVDSDDSSDH